MSGFIGTPSLEDIKRLEAQIQELRVIVSTLLPDEVFERFRDDWFPRCYVNPEK